MQVLYFPGADTNSDHNYFNNNVGHNATKWHNFQTFTSKKSENWTENYIMADDSTSCLQRDVDYDHHSWMNITGDLNFE